MPLEYSGVTCPPLLTLDDAKQHLRITDSDHDADVQQKLEVAQRAVLNFLGVSGDATWTEATVPEDVQHSIRLLLSHYYDNRGDDMSASPTADKDVWEAIGRLLAFHRDPTLA